LPGLDIAGVIPNKCGGAVRRTEMGEQAAGRLTIARQLRDFVAHEALPGTGVTEAQFWDGLSRIVATFAPRNRALLAKRDALQQKIDAWHDARRGQDLDRDDYVKFLTDIGYLLPLPGKFSVATGNVEWFPSATRAMR
jgi:malate synthase